MAKDTSTEFRYGVNDAHVQKLTIRAASLNARMAAVDGEPVRPEPPEVG